MPWQHTKFDASALPAARTMKAGCGPQPGVPAKPSSRRGRWRALVLLTVHVVIAARIWYWLTFGETLSPLEPSEAGETLTRGIVNAGFVLFAVATVSTLVFGRFFCGWACHVVALQDGCAWMLGKLGLSPKPVRSRLLAFVPLLVAFWMFVAPSLLQALEGTLPKEISVALTTEDFWARFPGPVMAVATFLAVGFLIVWLLGAKGFCTYGCPYGAVFAVADRFAKGRIRVTDDCNGCGHCTAVCTSNVEVHSEVASPARMVTDSGCMKCLDCVSACPKDALFFGFTARATAPEPKDEPGPPKRARAFDFTWPEEIALAVVFLSTVVFAYRRLYGMVPDLLAVTIALAAAFCAVIGWRLVTRRDLVVQHARLKVDGRLTARGRIAALALASFAAFTLHSGVVRYHDSASQARFAAFRIGGADAVDDARAALGHLDWLVRYGLWHEPQIDVARGRLLARLGQPLLAEEAFETALPRLDEAAAVRLELLDVQIALAATNAPALERASQTLTMVLDLVLGGDADLQQLDPTALAPLGARALRLESLAIASEESRSARPFANHARLLYAVGDEVRGGERRTYLTATYPTDPATLELERWLTQRAGP